MIKIKIQMVLGEFSSDSVNEGYLEITFQSL